MLLGEPFEFFFFYWEACAIDDCFVFLTVFTISFHNVNIYYLQAVNSIMVYFFKSCIIGESSNMK